MCTTTVYLGKGRRIITMNRDESRSRAPEIEPQATPARDGETHILMPIDGSSGGTWIGVNSKGVCAFLMNFYDEESISNPPTEFDRSRGEIVPKVLSGKSLREGERILLGEIDPVDYPPFLLAMVGSDEVSSWIWMGSGELKHSIHPPPWTLFTTSSVEPAGVEEWRKEFFRNWLAADWNSPKEVLAFHFHQDPNKPGWSPLMSRESSCTRSVTQISIEGSRGEISIRYWRRPIPHQPESPPTYAGQLTLDSLSKDR